MLPFSCSLSRISFWLFFLTFGKKSGLMASRISNCKDLLEDSLSDETKPWAPLLLYLEEKTGIKRFYLFLVTVILLGVYLVIGYAAQLVCNIIGFAYPAYASMKALESRETRDDTKWLTYWTVFAFFSLLEYPSDLLLYWFPFYWLLKCLFLVWLFIPLEFNGSVVIYNNVIRPKFLKHQTRVDDIISKVADSVTKTVIETASKAQKSD